MDLNDITSVIFTQWICLVTYTYLSGVPLSSHPITSGRFGWPNMGSLWSLSFHPFVSLGMSAILRATGGQSLCLQLLLLHMASMGLPFYPPVLGIIQVEDLACGKAYSLYLISQGAKPYCILVEEHVLLLRLRHRLQEFLDWKRQQFAFPSFHFLWHDTLPSQVAFHLPAKPIGSFSIAWAMLRLSSSSWTQPDWTLA